MISFQLQNGLSVLLSSKLKMYILNEVKKSTTKRDTHKINALLNRLTIT